MPLRAGKSKAAFESNLKELIASGHPMKQAFAAAFSKAAKKMADGGAVDDDDSSDEAPDTSSEGDDSEGDEGDDSTDDSSTPDSTPNTDSSQDPLADKVDNPAPTAPAPALSDAQKQQQMMDYLSKQYSQAADPTALKQAIAQQKTGNTIANVAQSIAQIGGAGGIAAGYKPDNSVFQGIKEQGAQNVANQAGLRQQNIDGFKEQQAIKAQVLQNALTSGDITKVNQANQIMKDAQDPGSQQSKNAQHRIAALFPNIVKSDKNPNGVDVSNWSSSDVDDATKDIGIKTNADDARARLQANALAVQQRQDFQNGQKVQAQDVAFTGTFGKLQQKNSAANADFDNVDAALNEAASGNGIAGNLAKAGALHDALGRVTQNELSMGQDPSIVNRLQSMFQKTTDGQSLTDKDIADFRQINAANRASSNKAFQTNAQGMTDAHDRATGRVDDKGNPIGYAASLVGIDQGQAAGPKVATQAPPSAPPPSGPTATDAKGNKIQWDGKQWVPVGGTK